MNEFFDRFLTFRKEFCLTKTSFFVVSEDKFDLDLKKIVSQIFFVNDMKDGLVFEGNDLWKIWEMNLIALVHNNEIMLTYFGFFDNELFKVCQMNRLLQRERERLFVFESEVNFNGWLKRKIRVLYKHSWK